MCDLTYLVFIVLVIVAIICEIYIVGVECVGWAED